VGNDRKDQAFNCRSEIAAGRQHQQAARASFGQDHADAKDCAADDRAGIGSGNSHDPGVGAVDDAGQVGGLCPDNGS